MIERIRYFYEHKFLPTSFFRDRHRFIQAFLLNSKASYLIFDDIVKQNECENPFKDEEFKTEIIKITDDVMVLKFNFPEPKMGTRCYCAYCFFDIMFKNLAYYTIEMAEPLPEFMIEMMKQIGEKVDELDDDMPFVCGWDEKENHLNYGKHPMDKDDLLDFCVKLYFNESSPKKVEGGRWDVRKNESGNN